MSLKKVGEARGSHILNYYSVKAKSSFLFPLVGTWYTAIRSIYWLGQVLVPYPQRR
jgi:hypothetical protein